MVNAELPKTYVAAKIEKITPQCKCFQRFNTPLRNTTPAPRTIPYMPPHSDTHASGKYTRGYESGSTPVAMRPTAVIAG